MRFESNVRNPIFNQTTVKNWPLKYQKHFIVDDLNVGNPIVDTQKLSIASADLNIVQEPPKLKDRGRSQGATTTRGNTTRRNRLVLQQLKTFNHPKVSLSIFSGEESVSFAGQPDPVASPKKNLPKLVFRKLKRRNTSI